ncbi:MAG: hypothetical protein AB1589_28020 [Cyanobacteriota bacterium]
MNAEIDPYPVSELQNRYGIGKQAVYNRLEALSIAAPWGKAQGWQRRTQL